MLLSEEEAQETLEILQQMAELADQEDLTDDN